MARITINGNSSGEREIPDVKAVSFNYLGEKIYSAEKVEKMVGVFISQPLMAPSGLVSWNEVSWTAQKPQGTDIWVYIKTADDPNILDNITWSGPHLNSTSDISDARGQYLQFLVLLTNDGSARRTNYENIEIAATPVLQSLSLSYLSSEEASKFFTKTFNLGFTPLHVLLTYNGDVPDASLVRFAVTGFDTTDIGEYQYITPNQIEELSNLSTLSEQLKIMIEMIGSSQVPIVIEEFALMFSGEDQLRINKESSSSSSTSSSSTSSSSSSSSIDSSSSSSGRPSSSSSSSSSSSIDSSSSSSSSEQHSSSSSSEQHSSSSSSSDQSSSSSSSEQSSSSSSSDQSSSSSSSEQSSSSSSSEQSSSSSSSDQSSSSSSSEQSSSSSSSDQSSSSSSSEQSSSSSSSDQSSSSSSSEQSSSSSSSDQSSSSSSSDQSSSSSSSEQSSSSSSSEQSSSSSSSEQSSSSSSDQSSSSSSSEQSSSSSSDQSSSSSSSDQSSSSSSSDQSSSSSSSDQSSSSSSSEQSSSSSSEQSSSSSSSDQSSSSSSSDQSSSSSSSEQSSSSSSEQSSSSSSSAGGGGDKYEASGFNPPEFEGCYELQTGFEYPAPWYKNGADIPLWYNTIDIDPFWQLGPNVFDDKFKSDDYAVDPTNGGNPYTVITGPGIAGTVSLGCIGGGGEPPPEP